MTQTVVIGHVLLKGSDAPLLMHVDDDGTMSLVVNDSGYNNVDIAFPDRLVLIRLAVALGCVMTGQEFPADYHGG